MSNETSSNAGSFQISLTPSGNTPSPSNYSDQSRNNDVKHDNSERSEQLSLDSSTTLESLPFSPLTDDEASTVVAYNEESKEQGLKNDNRREHLGNEEDAEQYFETAADALECVDMGDATCNEEFNKKDFDSDNLSEQDSEQYCETDSDETHVSNVSIWQICSDGDPDGTETTSPNLFSQSSISPKLNASSKQNETPRKHSYIDSSGSLKLRSIRLRKIRKRLIDLDFAATSNEDENHVGLETENQCQFAEKQALTVPSTSRGYVGLENRVFQESPNLSDSSESSGSRRRKYFPMRVNFDDPSTSKAGEWAELGNGRKQWDSMMSPLQQEIGTQSTSHGYARPGATDSEAERDMCCFSDSSASSGTRRRIRVLRKKYLTKAQRRILTKRRAIDQNTRLFKIGLGIASIKRVVVSMSTEHVRDNAVDELIESED